MPFQWKYNSLNESTIESYFHCIYGGLQKKIKQRKYDFVVQCTMKLYFRYHMGMKKKATKIQFCCIVYNEIVFSLQTWRAKKISIFYKVSLQIVILFFSKKTLEILKLKFKFPSCDIFFYTPLTLSLYC